MPKCRWCGKQIIDKENAFKDITKGGGFYYCSKNEYELKEFEKQQKIKEEAKVKADAAEKRAEERRKRIEEQKCELQEKQRIIRECGNKNPDIVDPVYEAVADIFDYRIANGALFNEMKLWRVICSDDNILSYLKENRNYIKNAISRKDMNEYQQVRYMSAILKNNLLNYKPKSIEKPKTVSAPISDFDLFVPTIVKKRERRSFAELEE